MKAAITYIFIAALFIILAGQTYILVTDIIAFSDEWAFIVVNYVADIFPYLFLMLIWAYLTGNDNDDNNRPAI